LRERHYFKVLAVDRRTILKWIFENKDSRLDSIDLAQEMDRMRVAVNTVLNLLVP